MQPGFAVCRGFDAPSDFTAYSNAKLYNQLTAVELQKRLEGSGVDVYLAQPGMSKTGLFDKGDHSKWAVWAQVTPLLPCPLGSQEEGLAGTLTLQPHYLSQTVADLAFGKSA